MRSVRLLVALLLAFLSVAARAESAGQIMFAYGEALALREGRIVHLIAGAPVESGDQIHTGVDSYVQIRFNDWSVISLRPRTDFVVEQYAYDPRQGGFERAFFVLLNGGVRSLTGLIGHRDRSHYRLRTMNATIGIRGTHYSVLICRQDCREADGSLGEDGLYGGVIDGRIAVSPYGGPVLEREFAAGEYFRLENENSIPVPLFAPPTFFWDKREPQALSGARTFAGIPWKPAPGTASSDSGSSSANGDLGPAPLLRTDGSLTLSPITAPLLSPASGFVGSTVGSVAAPVGSTIGPIAGALVSPAVPAASGVGAALGTVVTPVGVPLASTVGSTVGTLVTPAVAPIGATLGSTLGSVATPVIAPVTSIAAPMAAPIAAPIAPVVAPIATPIAPVVAPIAAPIAPVIAPIVAPIAPVVAPIAVAPVIAPPPPAVSLPTVPTLPVTSGLPVLGTKK